MHLTQNIIILSCILLVKHRHILSAFTPRPICFQACWFFIVVFMFSSSKCTSSSQTTSWCLPFDICLLNSLLRSSGDKSILFDTVKYVIDLHLHVSLLHGVSMVGILWHLLYLCAKQTGCYDLRMTRVQPQTVMMMITILCDRCVHTRTPLLYHHGIHE